KPLEYITHCPECGTELVRKESEAKHYCPNKNGCPPQISGRIEHFISRRAMNIDSLGIETINILIKAQYLRNYSDLYELWRYSEELVGIEISEKSYIKEHEQPLCINLDKSLFGALNNSKVTSNQIEGLLRNLNIIELGDLLALRESQDLLPLSNKQRLDLLSFIRFLNSNKALINTNNGLSISIIFKYLFNLSQLEFEIIDSISKHCSSIYDLFKNLKVENSEIFNSLNRDLEDKSLALSIQKLKNTTLQEKSIKTMIDGIELSKEQPFEKVLFALGIPFIGETSAKLITKRFSNIDSLMNADRDQLLDIDGVGEIMADSVLSFFRDNENRAIINSLKANGLNFSSSSEESTISNVLSGMKILTSGTLEGYKRDEFIKLVESHGGEYVKSVSKKLSFIVAGEDMGPSKRAKAEKDGIKIISESEFLELINN
ncbi:MAG: helix-hairpin-helix domain-containing protein, partial [Fulvivirga sp.]